MSARAIKQIKIFHEVDEIEQKSALSALKRLEMNVNEFLQNCEAKDTDVYLGRSVSIDGASTIITVVYVDSFTPAGDPA